MDAQAGRRRPAGLLAQPQERLRDEILLVPRQADRIRPLHRDHDALALEREPDLVPQVEGEAQAVEARADVGRGRRHPDPAARAGSVADGAHASSPYSSVPGPPSARFLRHLTNAQTTITTMAATTA